MSSEKITDHLMITEFNKVFGFNYNTNGNKELFKTKIPDGWHILDNNLFIIENKKSIKDKQKGLKQLIQYYRLLPENKFNNVYLVLGIGIESDFNYTIYIIKDNKMVKTNKTLADIKKEINPEVKTTIDIKDIHKFNQLLWDNGINLPKSQKTLFVSALLLTLKVNPNFLLSFNQKDKGFILADHMISTINEYYKDVIFTNSFNFIKTSLNNEILFKLFKLLDFNIKNHKADILNQFYNEFMLYDKNNDSAVGVVLTPEDIVDIMVESLNIKPDESIADFATGTGSFLMKAKEYTKNLIGCEMNEERYALAKCNFILNDLDYSQLYFNNCFNQQFGIYDHIIMNPPFGCNSNDDGKTKDIYNWRKFTKEVKFCLYQLQHLKDGGTGCWIIPRNNFNNSLKKINEFKKILLDNCRIIKIINCNSKVFQPVASVECTIIVFKKEKVKEEYETEIIDYTDDGFCIKDKRRYKINESKIKNYKKVLSFDDNWNYQQQMKQSPLTKILLLKKYKEFKEEIIKEIKAIEEKEDFIIEDYENNIKCYTEKLISSINDIKNLNQTIKEYKQIKISEYFEIPKLKQVANKDTYPNGEYPLISAGAENEGIIKYINHYDYDGEYLTVARSGTAGATFYRNDKFSICTACKLLKPLPNNKLDLKLIALILNEQLMRKYNYNNTIVNHKLLDEIINYPVFI